MIRKFFSYSLVIWLCILFTAACSGQLAQDPATGSDLTPGTNAAPLSPEDSSLQNRVTPTLATTLTPTVTPTPTTTLTPTITLSPTITPTPPPLQELLFYMTVPSGLERERCADIHQRLYISYTTALQEAINLPQGITNFYVTSSYSGLPAGLSTRQNLGDQKQCFQFSANLPPGTYYPRYHADISLDEATASRLSVQNPVAALDGYLQIRVLPPVTDFSQVVAAIGWELGANDLKMREVHVYSADGSQLTTFGRTVKEFALSPDGKYLAAIEDGGRLVIWDTATGEQADFATPRPNEAVESLAWLPDGSGLLYLIRGDLTLSRSNEVRVDTIASLPGTRSIRLSPDGQTVAYEKDDQLYTIGVDGSAAQAIGHDFSDVHEFKWSPDGSTIGFFSSSDTKLNLLDIATQTISIIDLGERKISFLSQRITIKDFSWSPDGNTILFNTVFSLLTSNADGGNQQQLLEDDGYNPVWSPDGEWILFRSAIIHGIHSSQHEQLYRIHPDGSGLEVFMIDDMRQYEKPQWIGSP